MRLTTKIILSIFLSIFILSLLFIIGFSFSDRRHYEGNRIYTNKLSIPQDNPIGIEVGTFCVAVFEEEVENVYSSYSGENILTLKSLTSSEENKLIIPEALNGYIVTKTNNDTLTIQIKTDELRKKYDEKEEKTHGLFSGINLTLHTTKVNVINNTNSSYQTIVSNIETDSIKIDSNGEILIESCKAIVIEPMRTRKFTIKNSVSQAINIDLDRIRNWNIEGCDIEIQNFTGSGRHNIKLHKNERGKINWYPKNENAVLNIEVPGDTTQIVLQ